MTLVILLTGLAIGYLAVTVALTPDCLLAVGDALSAILALQCPF